MPPVAWAQFQSRSGYRRPVRRQVRLGDGLRRNGRGLSANLGKVGSFLPERNSRPGKSDQRKRCPLDLGPTQTAPAAADGNRRGRNLHGALHLSRGCLREIMTWWILRRIPREV